MASKIIIGCIAATIGGAVSAQDFPRKYSSTEYFKNYALSTCIADGYKSDEVIKDSAAAARGYLEFGSLPLEAHTEATQLGRKYLQRKYMSISGESLILMKCIDFYHSKELDKLARKYRNKR
ncbi:MAG: type secretion protein [Rhodocyclales bacterium]|nr:type secretion protein [Rhodocyclales bacterium]